MQNIESTINYLRSDAQRCKPAARRAQLAVADMLEKRDWLALKEWYDITPDRIGSTRSARAIAGSILYQL